MSAVLAALFQDHQTAEAVRAELVRDGFPTDRVDMASRQSLGQADLVAADSPAEKLALHFQQLFPGKQRAASVDFLARSVLDGRAVIAVLPRGDIETRRALEILEQAQPLELRDRDLGQQPLEAAASPSDSTIIPNIAKILLGPGA